MGGSEGADDDESWMYADDEALPPQVRTVPPFKRGRGLKFLDIMKDEIVIDAMKRKKEEKRSAKLGKSKRYHIGSSEDDDSSDESDEFMKRQKVEKILDASQLIATAEREVAFKWGERIFGPQNHFPDCNVSESDTGLISRILKFKATGGKRSTALNMTSSGLLLSWVILEGRCDETTARWIFHQVAYSNNRFLENTARKILCDLLCRETRDGRPICRLEWVPSFQDIMDVFHIYGYLDKQDSGAAKSTKRVGSNLSGPEEGTSTEPVVNDERQGPPSNIRSLLQFLVPYFAARKWYHQRSISAAKTLVVTLIRCQLDRGMLNVSNLLQACLDALIDYFTEEEWTQSCKHIASAVSRISSTYVNNLRVAKSLHATNSRFGHLQRLVVLQLLSRRTKAKKDLSSSEDVVSIFKSVNIKDTECNFLDLHDLLILADIYLWSDPIVQKPRGLLVTWVEFLKKCSAQISSRDTRQGAMKVRNWASFLSQKYQVEKMHVDSNLQISM